MNRSEEWVKLIVPEHSCSQSKRVLLKIDVDMSQEN